MHDPETTRAECNIRPGLFQMSEGIKRLFRTALDLAQAKQRQIRRHQVTGFQPPSDQIEAAKESLFRLFQLVLLQKYAAQRDIHATHCAQFLIGVGQIKTFRLKYVFLAAKIIRTVRYVVIKLSEKYSYRDVYKNCLS